MTVYDKLREVDNEVTQARLGTGSSRLSHMEAALKALHEALSMARKEADDSAIRKQLGKV